MESLRLSAINKQPRVSLAFRHQHVRRVVWWAYRVAQARQFALLGYGTPSRRTFLVVAIAMDIDLHFSCSRVSGRVSAKREERTVSKTCSFSVVIVPRNRFPPPRSSQQAVLGWDLSFPYSCGRSNSLHRKTYSYTFSRSRPSPPPFVSEHADKLRENYHRRRARAPERAMDVSVSATAALNFGDRRRGKVFVSGEHPHS